MIELVNLTKRFGDLTAVSGISLTVNPGEVLALLGPNGAGKTTTVRMLAAILRPTSGRATVAGHEVTKSPGEVRRRVGLLTEHPGLYLRMRGSDYLDFFGRLMGMEDNLRAKRADNLLKRFGMMAVADHRIGTYSKGMRQKLALVRTMLHDPPVLLLDEPTSAMDPQSAKLVRDAVLRLCSQDRAVVLCTHNLAEAEMLADRIAIIRRGTVVALGTSAILKERLLGPALMELRLTQRVDGVTDILSNIVTIEAQGDTWLRYYTPDIEHTNPLVLSELVSRGVPVATLSEVPRSLEDVYMQVIGDTTDEHA